MYALLGVVSCGSKLERRLAELLPVPRFTPGPDRQIDAVLGLISLWSKAKAELLRWRERESQPNPEQDGAAPLADWSAWRR